MNNIIRPSVGADYAVEHIDPGIGMGHSPVMLSAAKHLDVHLDEKLKMHHLYRALNKLYSERHTLHG
jgi:ribosomal protein S15P/S13E